MFTKKIVQHLMKSKEMNESGSKTIKKPVEKKEESLFDKAVTWVKGIANIVSSTENLALVWQAAYEITKAYYFSDNQNVKQTLELIIESGSLARPGTDINHLKNTTSSIAARWSNEKSGREGAWSILKAIREAEKWTIWIVTFSGWSYKYYPLSSYKQNVRDDGSFINADILKAAVKLPNQIFDTKEWGSIWAYLAWRWWDSKLFSNDSGGKIQTFLKSQYVNYKTKQELEFKNIIWEELGRIQKENPKLAKLLLTKHNDVFNDTGSIDIKKLFEGKTSPAQVKIEKINSLKDIKWVDFSMKRNIDGKDILITIPDNILSKPIGMWTSDDVEKYLWNIQKAKNNTKDVNTKKILEVIFDLVSAKKKKTNNESKRAKVQNAEMVVQKIMAQNPNITLEEVQNNLEQTTSAREIAGRMAENRSELEDNKDALKKYWITSYEQAQAKYNELVKLQKQRPLTNEEKELFYGLESYLRIKKNEAIIYWGAVRSLWQEQAQTIFTETSRTVSGNPKESYNFKNLERAAIVLDNESSSADRSFAQLEPGKSLPIEKFIDNPAVLKSNPEAGNIKISQEKNGTYTITPKEWIWFTKTWLTEKIAKEYVNTIELFAEMWLGQLIPHLLTLVNEFNNKSIAIHMDWNMSDEEQRIFLGEVYNLLFWIRIETHDINEIKGKFIHLWPNIRQSLQKTFIKQNLIKEPNQSIWYEALITLLRSNDLPNMNKVYD
jgi:hypothetical protein